MIQKINLLLIISCLAFYSCSKDGDFNLMSVQEDIEMGEKLDQEIMSNPKEFPILDKASNPEAYQMVEGVMNEILKSDKINYRDEFPWQVRIINSEVYNAFAAPGGKLYFYTGILKYFDSEAELAGVMAHEIAHADLRHSSERMTKEYGLQILLGVLLGNNEGVLTEIASNLALGLTNLSFSREDEFEADKYSVLHLADKNTKDYLPTAITAFFDRIVKDGYDKEDGDFAFTRTHPYNKDRKENVVKEWENIKKPAGKLYDAEYAAFKSKL